MSECRSEFVGTDIDDFELDVDRGYLAIPVDGIEFACISGPEAQKLYQTVVK